MADVPADSSTDQVIAVGATITGQLESTGDHDWYRLELTAGQAVTVLLTAPLPLDTYLRIRDSSGNIIRDDVALSSNTNSRITFTPSATGTYFLDVGSFQDNGSGTYQLSVSPYTPPPVWNVEQVAEYLTEGGWYDFGPRRFDASPGGTITVNITKLNADGQYLAQQALALWSDITGIQFVEVMTGGQIQFDDNQPGAYAEVQYVNGIIITSFINITSLSTAIDGPNVNTHSFQAYIHEIGHSLGLAHAGEYNGASHDYLTDALYANDGWPLTVMSYFDQEASAYFADRGFSYALIGTPMIADIAAMQMLYGLSTTTRTGNTTYGFNSNAGRDVFNANLHDDIAYTIFDSGGVDTLDYSGFSANQVIRLTAGTYSNVGGLTGTVVIALGTVIENAIGGSGNDQLIGNAADNRLTGGGGNDTLNGGGGIDTLIGGSGADTLAGGAGSDVFRGTAADLSGDTISDFAVGDRIIIGDASLASFTYSLSSSTLTYSGGSLTFGSALAGTIVATAAPEGGVQLTLAVAPPPPPRAKMILTESGQDFTVGGNIAIFGTAASGEVIEVIRGDVLLDASFNIGGDTVVLPGNAGSYTAILSGSFVTIAGGGISIAIPIGAIGLAVQFADSTRTLRFDAESGQVVLGTQQVTATEAAVAASGPPLTDPAEVGPESLAKLILTEPGQDIDIGGNVSIFGTAGPGEVVTVLSGTVQLDASFNIGGDTVVLPGNAGTYSATLSGSFVTIAGGDISVAIPIGLNGITVDFADGSALLRYDPDSGQVMLGDGVVSPAGSVAAEPLFAGKATADTLAFDHLPDSPRLALELDSFSFG